MQSLFREYLTNLRASKLQQSHALLIADDGAQSASHARLAAFEAELVSRIREAFDVYEKSTERFLKEYLSQ